MDINQINLKKIERKQLEALLMSGCIDQPSRKEWKGLADTIVQAIQNNNYMVAANGLTVLVYFDTDNTFETIRRKGIFRYYNYVSKKCMVCNLATDFKKACHAFGRLDPARTAYLDSIINLSPFYDIYSSIEKKLLNAIRKFGKKYPQRSFVKTLFAYADFLFMNRQAFVERFPEDEWEGRTEEDIGAAVSFAVFFYTSRYDNKPLPTSEEYILDGSANQLLLLICHYLDFKEYEILVEHFGYICTHEDGILKLAPPFDDLEKSIRLGYIRTDFQFWNDLASATLPDALSILDLAKKILSVDAQVLFEKTEDKNYPRYRMSMTVDIVNWLADNFIKPDALFIEEFIYLGTIIKEQLLTVEDLKKMPVKGTLTLFNFIKARRWFLITAMLFENYLRQISEQDIDIILRSLVTQLSEEQLHELLDRVVSPEQAEDFLDILCWEPGSKHMYDLQYQPMFFSNDYFEIPLFIVAHSNAVRNLYASQYKQSNTFLMKDGNTDALVDQLISVLSKAGLAPCYNIAIDGTDIDVCCVFGDTLYVFECKHTLHPVSVFDLRTMHDHLRHAEKQLSIIETAFNAGTLPHTLARKTHIDVSVIKKIRPAIIVSNRLLNGHIFNYPVRYIKEVANVLLEGTLKTPEGTFWLWPQEQLEQNFMYTYFGNDSEISKMHYNCLTPKISKHTFCKPAVQFNTFSMHMKYANKVVAAYTSGLRKADITE
jgi:hypothetical protein